ncbi:MAG: hypothetical protein BEN19_01615 [Epulopiscium sp. Nuni2H_MBin003]|nr:MAG: hypothetical protein BEN19_01615 [Epulopiscium sp. Nuni2H_MBin003]
MKYIILLILLLPINVGAQPITQTEFLMGTFASITSFKKTNTSIVNQCFDTLFSLDNTLSLTKEDSLINNLGMKKTTLPPDIYNLIQRGLYYSYQSQGAFDITIAPLTNLWRIGFDDAKIPTEKEIITAQNLVNYNNVVLEDNSIYFLKPNMKLDLGSIAKGYATDIVVDILTKNNVDKSIINIGGNVYILSNTPLTVELQDPHAATGETFATLSLSNQSIVTTGIYERYLDEYHHILDPKTGYPYQNELPSVSIIGTSSLDSDCLSTTAFALGLESGLKYIEHLPDYEGIFVTKDKKVYVTPNVNLVITNKDYEIYDL